MRINDIIENSNTRKEILTNDRSLKLMEEYKQTTNIKGMEYETIEKVAEYYQVEYHIIYRVIERNKEELLNNGLLILNANDTKEKLALNNLFSTNYRGYFIADNRKFNNRNNMLINKRCFLLIGMLLRDSEVAKKLRSLMLDTILNNNTDTNISNNTNEISIEEYNKLYDIINKQSEIIKILNEKVNSIDENLKELNNNLKVDTDNLNIKDNFNYKRFNELINNLSDKITITKKEYLELFNSYEFYEYIGIKKFNEILTNNNIIFGNDRITEFSKENNLLTRINYNNYNKLALTKKGILYITDIIINL